MQNNNRSNALIPRRLVDYDTVARVFWISLAMSAGDHDLCGEYDRSVSAENEKIKIVCK
jgi:hypothetical protein